MALTFLLPCILLSRLNDNMNERKEASVEDQCVLGAGVETAWRRGHRERSGYTDPEFKAVADAVSATGHKNTLSLLTLPLPEKAINSNDHK